MGALAQDNRLVDRARYADLAKRATDITMLYKLRKLKKHEYVLALAPIEDERRALRARAMADLWVFIDLVLQWPDLHPPMHSKLASGLNSLEELLVLISRNCLKSTICTVSFPIWLAAKFPNIRVLICSESGANASKWINEQITILKTHQIFRWVFPELAVAHDYGYVDEWTHPLKTAIQGEPTVGMASVDKNITSRHVEVAIVDDILGEVSARTTNGIERAQQWFEQLQPIITRKKPNENGPAFQIIVGTTWHYDDFYARLRQTSIPKIVMPAILPNGEPACPTMLPTEALERLQHGPTAPSRAIFSAQWLMNPLPEGDQIFQLADVERAYYDPQKFTLPESRRYLSIVITCDLAEAGKDNDLTCLMVTGVDHKGECYVLDYVADRMQPTTIFDRLYTLTDKWGAHTIFAEKNGPGKDLIKAITEEGYHRKRHLNIKGFTTRSDMSKEDRVKFFLQSHVEHGRIHLLKGTHADLIDQMTRFPKTHYDDIVDALAMRYEEANWSAPPPAPLEPNRDIRWSMDDIDRLYPNPKYEDAKKQMAAADSKLMDFIMNSKKKNR